MIITLQQVAVFFLVFARLAGMITLAPVFSRKQIFGMAKVSILFWLSISLIFVIPLPMEFPTNLISYTFAIFSELFLGVVIGFIADLVITGVEFAGTLMDTQAGLSVASLLDPATGRQTTLIEMTLNWVVLLIFLLIDGHHIVLSATVESFKILPVGQPFNFNQSTQFLLDLGATLFKIGLQLSVPILLIVFIIDFTLGLLNKVAEQINVFQLGFQVKPPISLLIFLGTIGGLSGHITVILKDTLEQILTFLRLVTG